MKAQACDCHAHVFGPLDRFPFAENRSYTPPERHPADYAAMLDALGVERGVIVQPSVYGTDNRATLAAIAELGPDFRGVAVVSPDVTDAALADLASGGIRGVRLSDLTTGGVPLVHLEAMAERLRGSGWHIQLLADFGKDGDLPDRIAKLPVPVVIDHLGLLDPAQGTLSAGFTALAGLLRDGHCWLKLSGPYLVSKAGAPFTDVDAVARGFVETFAQRLVWGTDWPHPASREPVDDAVLLAALERWTPDPSTRRRILVDNPATLYGFPLTI